MADGLRARARVRTRGQERRKRERHEDARHCGRRSLEDAFDVVTPSMPGYGFSGKATGTGWDPDHIARTWAELMKRLGYTRYVAQGGDWGSPVSSAMARQAPAGLLGIHINLPATVPPEVAAVLPTGGPAPAGLSEKERAVVDVLLANAKMGNTAYVVMIGALPQTVGHGVTDSPAGLAAWLVGHPGEADKGGHFAAWEQPELFAAELRAAFKSLRPADPKVSAR
jgi:pimeloyl-ACP methyl ester carboxylesterase